MPRIEPLKPEEMVGFEEQFERAEKDGRAVPNFVRTIARRPEIAKAHSALRTAVIGPGTVSAELKNFVAQVASASAGCNYCWAHNADFAEKMGVPDEKEAALWAYETSPLFDDAERAALCIAQGAAQVPNAVTDQDFDELKKHFSDEQIVEIVSVIALFGFLNRFNDTMATELETQPVKAGEKHLAAHGWHVGNHAAARDPR
ncbi:MAG: carboxymuconolactone decarboxylase family protein [Proteobacteria bacterium]|nr:carboxymuconolactone decarboxylase family protein [Pseudomonadota bacterium]